MIYVLDFSDWQDQDVLEGCQTYGIKFQSGHLFPATCTKLASHLVKKAISDDNAIPLNLIVGAHGKPEFEAEKIHFNISHQNHVVIAVVSSEPVGIDICENTSPFTEEQLDLLYTKRPHTGHVGIYWAAREAYLKYTGEGIREGPLNVSAPAHTAYPDLEHMSEFAVMPAISVENTFARCFKVKNMVGAVIAPKIDLQEIQCSHFIGLACHHFHCPLRLISTLGRVYHPHSINSMESPPNFGLVGSALYRSSAPKPEHFPFLRSLGLKSILLLLPEPYATENQEFCAQEGIKLFQVGLSGNKEPFVHVDPSDLEKALRIALDVNNHPLLIHCNMGKHRTGCVVGCIRRLQDWHLSLIFEEYRHYAFPKARPLDYLIIEMFDDSLKDDETVQNGVKAIWS